MHDSRDDRRLRFGPYEARAETSELFREGARVPIQRQPFEMLLCLLEHPGRVFAREELYARLWPAGTFVDFEHGLNTVVRKLRRALGDAPDRPSYVETVPGRGYRFAAAVEPIRQVAVVSGDGVSSSPRSELLARPPFVGREREISRLERRLSLAMEGRGGLALVAGEPGIGKTRLLEELIEVARRRRAHVMAGRCTEGLEGPGYRPLSEALTRWVTEVDAAFLRDVGDGATWAVVAKLAPSVRVKLPDLAEPPTLRPDEEKLRLFDAVAKVLSGIAKSGGALLVLDDLHWADSGTLALVTHVARVASETPLLLVGALRDGETQPTHPVAHVVDVFSSDAGFEQLSLVGLERESVQTWLEGVSDEGVPDTVVEEVLRATNGNPFFLRELVTEWARERLEAGAQASPAAVGVPQTIRSMVERRLAKLSEDARRLLACAAACSSTFLFEAVAHTAELGEEAALEALDEAHRAQLIRPFGGPDDYEFVHALIRSVVYQSLTPARRVRVHRRLAEELEREAASGGPTRSAEIADHYHASRDLRGASGGVRHALDAARTAESSADLEGAARLLQIAIDLAPSDGPQRPRLAARRALALAWGTHPDETVEAAQHAADLLEVSEGRDAAADFLVEVTVVLREQHRMHAWKLGARARSLLNGRRDLAWARIAGIERFENAALRDDAYGMPCGDFPDRLEAAQILRSVSEAVDAVSSTFFESRDDASHWPPEALRVGFVVGDYRAALPLFDERIEPSLRTGRLASAAMDLAMSARLQLALGEIADADRRFAAALDLYERTGRSASVLGQLAGFPFERAALMDTGFDQLASVYQAIVDDPAPENRWLAAPMWIAAAYSYARLGDRNRASAYLERCEAAIERSEAWEINYVFLLLWASATAWELGSKATAGVLERNLREKLLQPDFRYPNTDVRLSLARACALADRFDEAVEWFARAREVLDEQGARPLRAITDFDEALMYARHGRRDDAARMRSLLDTAVQQFEAIGMPGWIERAERLLHA